MPGGPWYWGLFIHVRGSIIGGTSKWMVYNGKLPWNGWLAILGNLHVKRHDCVYPFQKKLNYPMKNSSTFRHCDFSQTRRPRTYCGWGSPFLGSSWFGFSESQQLWSTRPSAAFRSFPLIWDPWLIRFSNMCSNVEQKAGRGTDPFSARELVPTSFSDFGRQKGTHKWRLQTVKHVWFSSNSRVCVNCPRHGSLDRCLTKYLIVWPMWVGCTY